MYFREDLLKLLLFKWNIMLVEFLYLKLAKEHLIIHHCIAAFDVRKYISVFLRHRSIQFLKFNNYSIVLLFFFEIHFSNFINHVENYLWLFGPEGASEFLMGPFLSETFIPILTKNDVPPRFSENKHRFNFLCGIVWHSREELNSQWTLKS